jgi:hypothetical protein
MTAVLQDVVGVQQLDTVPLPMVRGLYFIPLLTYNFPAQMARDSMRLWLFDADPSHEAIFHEFTATASTVETIPLPVSAF